MKDLESISGLPVKLDGNKLVFGKGARKVKPDVRKAGEMTAVLMEPSAKKPKEFYYMYRGVCLEKDSAAFEKTGQRYDITVLPPFKVGGEFNKTLGHYHPKERGGSMKYPEVYEVLNGTAHYLQQKKDSVLFTEATAGDKVIMFPGYGHITINPSNETLVMANIVYSKFKSEYGLIEKMHGGMYFETEKGWRVNSNYGKAPPIRLFSARAVPEFGLNEEPMYASFMKDQGKFEWLKKPGKYKKKFLEILGGCK